MGVGRNADGSDAGLSLRIIDAVTKPTGSQGQEQSTPLSHCWVTSDKMLNSLCLIHLSQTKTASLLIGL